MDSELRTKALDSVNTTRKIYGDFAAQLTDTQRNANGSFEPYFAWSAKDVLAHISFWDAQVATRFETTARGETFTPIEDGQKQNTETFQNRKDWTWDKVWGEVTSALDRMEAFIKTASDELLQGGDGRPEVWMQIQNVTLLHGGAHLSDYWLSQNDIPRAEALYDSTIEAFESTRGKEGRSTAVYNKACMYAKSGLKDKAMPLLTEALEVAPNLREFSKQDTDLELLHKDPDFLALAEQPVP